MSSILRRKGSSCDLAPLVLGVITCTAAGRIDLLLNSLDVRT